MIQAFYKPKPLWLLAIAIPITGILLSSFNSAKLITPYRYPFSSVPSNNNRTAKIRQEIAFYKEQVRQNPQSGLDLASLAKAYLSMAKATGESSWYLLAEQTATRSISILPFNNNSAVIVLARVAEARHDFGEAIRLSQMVETRQHNEEALTVILTSNLAIGKLQAAKNAADILVNKIPSQGNLTLQALVQIAQGQNQQAIDTLNLALTVEEAGEAGTSAWTRVLLGQTYYKQGQIDLAEKLYKEALRILPRYPLALLHLAELETRKGEYETALNYYAQVLPDSKDSSTIFDHVIARGKARIKLLQAKQQEAIALLNQAETLLRSENATGDRKGNFGHRRELARLLLEKNQPTDVAEALSLMQVEVSIRRDAQTLDTLAWALSSSGQYKQAQQVIQEALQLGTRDAGLFYRAAIIEKALANNQQAIAYEKMAKEVNPTFDEQARRTLGLGLENFGF